MAAKNPPSEARSWLSRTDADPGWSRRLESPPRKGTAFADGQAQSRQKDQLERPLTLGISRRLRLRQATDFARVRIEGKVYRHPYIILSLASNSLPHNRYGFITPKHLGKAVTRNRVRRLLREVVRQLHPGLVAGFDVVLVARSAIVGQQLSAIHNALIETLQRAGLLRDEDTL